MFSCYAGQGRICSVQLRLLTAMDRFDLQQLLWKTSTYSCYGGFGAVSRWWVGDVGTEEDDRFTEHRRTEKISYTI